MISDNIRQQLYIFARNCFAIQNKLVLTTSILTPLNFEDEKRKFFESTKYNPVFFYNGKTLKNYSKEIQELKKELKKIKIPHDLRQYLEEYLQDLFLLQTTVQSLGTHEYWYHAKKLFNYMDEDAEKLVKTLPKFQIRPINKKKMFDAYQIAEMFRKTLHETYDISDYEVEVDEFSSHIIRAGLKKAAIGNKVKRYQENVERLIVHEIESHVLQNYNIRMNKNPMIKLIRPRESHVYAEGLAVYNEIHTKTITEKSFNDYYYRLQAVGMLHKSYRQIFNYLKHYMNEDHAFLLTFRVKRGMHETERSGGFPKDAAYLLGVTKIHEFIKHGSKLDFLYLGKVPTLTSLLSSHGLLTQSKIYFPNFLNKKAYHATIP